MNVNRPPQRLDAANKSRTAADQLYLEQQQQLAKGRLDRAYQLKVAGDDEGARMALAEAVRTNAALVTDSAAVSLAQALTGEPRDKAIVALLEHSQTAPLPSRQPVFRITPDGLGFAVEALLLPLAWTVCFGALSPLLAVLLVGQNGSIVARLGGDAILLGGTLTHVGASIGFAIWTLMDIIGMYLLGTLLGGSGVLLHFARQMTAAISVWALLLTAVAIVALFGLRSISSLSLTASGELQLSALITVCVWLLQIITVLSPIAFGAIVGRVLAISWTRGVLAVVMSTGVLGVLTLAVLGLVQFSL